ncbi:MAG: 4-hydroxybenzoate octaprenyltransferase [Gammaproteobacteria bacterium]|nr:4-hydroxybenzoate octaprenyltransferase [Gammaproteobacteria bacterium]
MTDRLYQYGLLMRLDRPIGILLLLWPTLWALFIAGEGHPDGLVVIVFVIGVFLMRSAGCVINDYADRKIDPYVARTRERPIASGKVTPKEALKLFAGLCLVAFMLVLLMNTFTIMLSFVGVFLAATYPFMKRYTYLPQPYLGAAFGWAIPMAFAAQTGTIPVVAWLMFIAVILWATAYDTMYAMVDRKDDLRIGVRSTAILFGDADRIIIGLIQLTLMWVLLLIGKQLSFGLYYYLGLAVALALAIYQQYLIYHREPEKCFRAFLNNNWFGLAVFGGIVGQYYLA